MHVLQECSWVFLPTGPVAAVHMPTLKKKKEKKEKPFANANRLSLKCLYSTDWAEWQHYSSLEFTPYLEVRSNNKVNYKLSNSLHTVSRGKPGWEINFPNETALWCFLFTWRRNWRDKASWSLVCGKLRSKIRKKEKKKVR